MIREYFIHQAHRLKHSLSVTRPFTGRGILMKWSDKIIGSPSKPIILKTLHGFKLFIDPIIDNGVERSIFYTGTYEAGTLYIFKQILSSGDVVIDVGANIGLMTLYASSRIGENGYVHAFEPEPDTFKILSQNCALNKKSNIKINKIALGREKKTAIIYPNLDINRGSSSLVRQDNTNGKIVNVIRLDEYLHLKQLDSLKLIKIDVEGYEIEVLEGGREIFKSDRAPIICIEYSGQIASEDSLAGIYDLIIQMGYSIYKFSESKGVECKLKQVNGKNEMPLHDNIFCFKKNHLSILEKIVEQ
ncbi:MAG: FkbM family methyltransferase [Bacteroidota bacterium]|jgi:FkbM family methyltransferase